MFNQVLTFLTNIFTYLFYFVDQIFDSIPGSLDFWVAMFAAFAVYKMILQPFFGSAGSDRAKKRSGKSKGKSGGKGKGS